MILTKSSEDGLRNRRAHVKYDNITVRDYWRESERPVWPHAYLVEQAANSTIRPHFHAVDQFQVIVQGGGTLGRDEVGPVTVHYADAYTGYGPIISRAEGLSYFTLRTTFDSGLHGLPESRGEQRRFRPGPPRHRVGAVDIDKSATPHSHEVISPEPDGLRALFMRIPAHTSMAASDGTGGAAHYILVLSGNVKVTDRSLGTWSCVFATPDEPPPQLVGGPEGARVLFLRFPWARNERTGR